MRSFLLALIFSGSLGEQKECSDCPALTWERFDVDGAESDPYCCATGGDDRAEWWGTTADTDDYWYCSNYRCSSESGYSVPDASAGGDPVTRFENRETRFWLATDVLTYVFKQLSYTIFYRAGPARATSDPRRRGDWVVEAEVRLGGTRPETIHIEMVDPDLLNGETAFPVLGANLTTIRLSVGDKQLVVGNHSLSAGAVSISVAPLGKSSRIGNGFVERVEIKGDGIHVRFTSAKAQKFSDEAKQVKALHLDCEFVKFNRTAARGPLPEMWGLQPLSTETMLLLVPPKIAAQVDGSIIEA